MHSSEMSTPAGPALNQIIKSLGDEGIECKGESRWGKAEKISGALNDMWGVCSLSMGNVKLLKDFKQENYY